MPRGLRESGFGLGASRWQVVRQLVLPSAAPGILTGTVLALSRALGETAPLILVGAVLGSFSSGGSLADLFSGPYAALPTIVFDWARKPQEEFRALTSAAILVLLAVTILANTAPSSCATGTTGDGDRGPAGLGRRSTRARPSPTIPNVTETP